MVQELNWVRQDLQAHQQDVGEDQGGDEGRVVQELGGVQQDLKARQKDRGEDQGGDKDDGQDYKQMKVNINDTITHASKTSWELLGTLEFVQRGYFVLDII